jgi:hypothetical protein
MKIFRLGALAVCLVLLAFAIAVHVYRWADSRFRADMAVAIRHKSGQHAPGTVLTVSKTELKEKLPSVRICFTIDSFSEVAIEDRSDYERAERARQKAEGPRCEKSYAIPFADSLKPGDHLDVSFTLENGNRVAVSRLSANGQEL